MSDRIRLLARNLAVCAAAAGVLSGCSDRGPVPVTSPSLVTPGPQPRPTQGNYTVSGVVSAVAGAVEQPLEGVHVEDSQRHVFVKTGADGSFTIREVQGGGAYFYFAKEGFRSQTRQFELSADTRLDIRLVRE
jgi:hypothetical protein